MESMPEPLVIVRGLKKYYAAGGTSHKRTDLVYAVDNVSFDIQRGETLGLVGESGCGKSTTGLAILRLIEPTSGEIWFGNNLITSLDPEVLRLLRKDMQIIFQDPYASLNERMKAGEIISEGLTIHRLVKRDEKAERIAQLLETVGLEPEHAKRYPHEFSSGQRQRLAIARVLALRPKFVVADEPVSSLDVSIQAQVINLLIELQKKFHLTVLFISHDLSVVRHLADRVAVMYLGKIVELAPSSLLYLHPRHPYTEALLSAVPIPDPAVKGKRILLEGDTPSPISPPSGCRFHPRCRLRTSECTSIEPFLVEVSPSHQVACHMRAFKMAEEIAEEKAIDRMVF
jgi:oligopeptide transport system ATP-binding protein